MFSFSAKVKYTISTLIGVAISTTIFAATPKTRTEEDIEYHTSIPFNKCQQLIHETYLQSGATESQVQTNEYKYSETFSTAEKIILMICYKSNKMYTKIVHLPK